MKAAIYARLSEIDDSSAATANLEQQTARGRQYAEDQGWEVIGTYIEPGKSTCHDERRRVFPALLADIEAAR